MVCVCVCLGMMAGSVLHGTVDRQNYEFFHSKSVALVPFHAGNGIIIIMIGYYNCYYFNYYYNL